MKDFVQAQQELCQKYGVEYQPLDFGLKLGVAEDFFSGRLPLNGLRHPPEADTCGWYLWSGEELSTGSEYFKPLHASHLLEQCPSIIPYLALPVGWRFLLAGDYADVWFDVNLLDI